MHYIVKTDKNKYFASSLEQARLIAEALTLVGEKATILEPVVA